MAPRPAGSSGIPASYTPGPQAELAIVATSLHPAFSSFNVTGFDRNQAFGDVIGGGTSTPYYSLGVRALLLL